MTLISVIIPTFNSENTIRETLDSVFNQTFSDFEIIIINDGSTDRTIELLGKISDSRVKVFSYPNSGVSISRNRGISYASGEFISFLDADDLWTPDKLETQLQALKTHPEAAVAYSWTDCIDEAGNFLYQGMHISPSGYVLGDLLLRNFLQNGSNPLIRKTALLDVGEFDPFLNPCEDRDMWLRLAAKYHFIAVSSPQILYRISSDSMSSSITKLEKSGLCVLKKAFDRAPKSLQYLRQQSLSNHYRGLVWKTTDGTPNDKNGFLAFKYFIKYLFYDPTPWRDLRAKASLMRKIIKIILESLKTEIPLENKRATSIKIDTM